MNKLFSCIKLTISYEVVNLMKPLDRCVWCVQAGEVADAAADASRWEFLYHLCWQRC